MKSLHQQTLIKLGLKGIVPVIITILFTEIIHAQGRVGINVDIPQAMLHVKDSSVLFSGVSGIPSSPGPVPVSGEGVRLLWYSGKAAFRAGYASGTEWNRDSIGYYSFAAGGRTKAKAYYSTAFGESAVASGTASVAMGGAVRASGTASVSLGFWTEAIGSASIALGAFAIASGDRSVAMGNSTIASGDNATALGSYTEAVENGATALGNVTLASGLGSTAMGSSTIASGSSATAMGEISIASGDAAAAIGYNAQAHGDYSIATGYATLATGQFATATGALTRAQGDLSTALGIGTIANGSGSLVIGQYNDTIVAAQESPFPSTPVFIIGNGSLGDHSNAMVVRRDGLVGLGTNTPLNVLDIEGSLAVGNTYSGSIAAPNNGAIIQGSVGIGTSTPERKLEVAGNNLQAVRITSLNNGRAALELQRLGAGQDWRIIDSTGFLFFGVSTDDLASVSEVLRLTAIGVTPAADNSINLGSGSLRWTEVHAVNGTIQTSDVREKESIIKLQQGLSAVMQLRPVSYTWKDAQIDQKKRHFGFLAQDLQQVVPEVVTSYHWTESTNATSRTWEPSDRLGVNYSELIPVLTVAIQELEALIKDQQERIKILEQENDRITRLVAELH